jgi:hypothetical protein
MTKLYYRGGQHSTGHDETKLYDITGHNYTGKRTGQDTTGKVRVGGQDRTRE